MSGIHTVVLNARPGEWRATALDADGTPKELRLIRTFKQHLAGAIALGRVRAVRSDINAAFVDIGAGVDGFLNLGKGKTCDMRGAEIREGALILVRVVREATASKGPTLSCRLDIESAHFQIAPGHTEVVIPDAMSDAAWRERLATKLMALVSVHRGLVVKAGAADIKRSALIAEAQELLAEFDALLNAAEKASAPGRIKQPPSPLADVLKRWDGLARVIVDDPVFLSVVEAYAAQSALPPDIIMLSREVRERLPDLAEIWSDALQPVVPVPGGGRLIIDETAALCAIDVDTGDAGPRGTEAILRVNLAAARVVAAVLRQRNIGGLVVVDFLKMDKAADNAALMRALTDALANDPSSPQAIGVSGFGLVQISRRRQGPSLAQVVLTRTWEVTAETAALHALADIAHRGGTSATIRAGRGVADALKGQLTGVLAETSSRLGFDIAIEAVDDLPSNEYRLDEIGSR